MRVHGRALRDNLGDSCNAAERWALAAGTRRGKLSGCGEGLDPRVRRQFARRAVPVERIADAHAEQAPPVAQRGSGQLGLLRSPATRHPDIGAAGRSDPLGRGRMAHPKRDVERRRRELCQVLSAHPLERPSECLSGADQRRRRTRPRHARGDASTPGDQSERKLRDVRGTGRTPARRRSIPHRRERARPARPTGARPRSRTTRAW